METQGTASTVAEFLSRAGRPCNEAEIRSAVGDRFDAEIKELVAAHKIETRSLPWKGHSDSLNVFWLTNSSETDELAILRRRLQTIETELTGYDKQEYDKEIVDHMNRLHDYNELKDTAQMLMGQLAVIEGGLTRDLYKRYGLELED